MELWFCHFSSGGDPDLSGFEHIIAGEQEGAKVQGYHFWYKWMAPDYDAMAMRPLTKRKGEFFVGCSAEGLMAMGTVRAPL